MSTIISQHLASVSQHLSTHQELFRSIIVYPLPEFPGTTQENLLGQLLRKKLEPRVEDWVCEARGIASSTANSRSLTGTELQQSWSRAGMALIEQVREHTGDGSYNLEKEIEVENVDGLRRQLQEDPDESSSDGNSDEPMKDATDEGRSTSDAISKDEMEVVGVHRKPNGDGVEYDLNVDTEHKVAEPIRNAMPINDVLRFLMLGTIRPVSSV